MKLATANAIRAKYVDELMNYLADKNMPYGDGEDVGLITSNTFNFPIVTDDGEEAWVEISVKVPKGTKDEEYDGYSRREQYEIAQKEKADKKAKREAESKAKKEKVKAE